MTKKDLKLMAGSIVMESDYSNSAKKQLLNFILKEANEAQLKVLILDKKIEKLDKDAINIVSERFDIFEKENKKLEILFEEEGHGWSSSNLPKGWNKNSVKKYWNSLTGDRKNKITQCIKQMKGKVSDAGKFCGGLSSFVGYR